MILRFFFNNSLYYLNFRCCCCFFLPVNFLAFICLCDNISSSLSFLEANRCPPSSRLLIWNLIFFSARKPCSILSFCLEHVRALTIGVFYAIKIFYFIYFIFFNFSTHMLEFNFPCIFSFHVSHLVEALSTSTHHLFLTIFFFLYFD